MTDPDFLPETGFGQIIFITNRNLRGESSVVGEVADLSIFLA